MNLSRSKASPLSSNGQTTCRSGQNGYTVPAPYQNCRTGPTQPEEGLRQSLALSDLGHRRLLEHTRIDHQNLSLEAIHKITYSADLRLATTSFIAPIPFFHLTPVAPITYHPLEGAYMTNWAKRLSICREWQYIQPQTDPLSS